MSLSFLSKWLTLNAIQLDPLSLLISREENRELIKFYLSLINLCKSDPWIYMIIAIDVYSWRNATTGAFSRICNMEIWIFGNYYMSSPSPTLVSRMNRKEDHDRSLDGRWPTRSYLDDHNHYVYLYIYIFIAYIIHIYHLAPRKGERKRVSTKGEFWNK